MKLASWGSDLLELLLPQGCAACRGWLASGRTSGPICAPCRSRLRRASWPRCVRCHFPTAAGRAEASVCPECQDWSPSVLRARYAYVLAPPASDLVHALKYEGWSELADLMGSALVELTAHARGGVVVPVPTTPSRMRTRGYNQAELLARRVARSCDGPLVPALVRPREGRSQTSLTPTERRENVRGVFAAVRGEEARVAGEDVVLVDDVLTTGATASEAADVLAAMGAASVTLITFARALPRDP